LFLREPCGSSLLLCSKQAVPPAVALMPYDPSFKMNVLINSIVRKKGDHKEKRRDPRGDNLWLFTTQRHKVAPWNVVPLKIDLIFKPIEKSKNNI